MIRSWRGWRSCLSWKSCLSWRGRRSHLSWRASHDLPELEEEELPKQDALKDLELTNREGIEKLPTGGPTTAREGQVLDPGIHTSAGDDVGLKASKC